MKMVRTLGAALLAANWTVASAWGASCVNSDDLFALGTAAIQQELMVAAFTCNDVARYNRFVVSHQSELIDSDSRLKAFFVHRGGQRGEAGYHTYKTELANAASLRSVRRAASFCAHANEEFDLAAQSANLSEFVGAQPIALGAAYRACGGNRLNSPVLAETSIRHKIHRR